MKFMSALKRLRCSFILWVWGGGDSCMKQMGMLAVSPLTRWESGCPYLSEKIKYMNWCIESFFFF